MPTAKKGAAKKSTAKKVPAKKPTKKAAPAKKAAGGQGLMKEMQPSAELAAIVGSKPLPRTQVTKKLWDYIKSNGLQDSQNKRMINADAKLQSIFGGKKQVSMFEMTKLVSRHIK
jgi:upstream activation factor subunit UAF30